MEFFFGIFDNDKERNLEHLKTEEDQIKRSFSDLKNGLSDSQKGRLDVQSTYNIGVDNFKSELEQHANRITIFHFSGHHGEGQTQLSDQKITDEGVIQILNNCSRLKMVFLNGCNTKSAIQQLSNVPIVIGTTKAVGDALATAISSRFYALLCKDIDNFLDSEKIKNLFEQAKGFEALVDEGKQRGEGGWQEKEVQNALDFYTITINKEAKDFEERVVYYSDISKYPVKAKYKEQVYRWFDTLPTPITEELKGQEIFHAYYPKNLSFLLERLSYDENTLTPVSQKLGEKRFGLIKDIFFKLLNFFKYCSYSMVWTRLNNNTIQLNGLKKRIETQLRISWYTTVKEERLKQRITHLKEVQRSILPLQENEPSVQYAYNTFSKEIYNFLEEHETELLFFCSIFSASVEEDNLTNIKLVQAEKFLYFFVQHCGFLTNYAFASVHGSLFFKYRIEEKRYEYEVKYFPKGPFPGGSVLQNFKDEIYDVYSILLMDKRQQAALEMEEQEDRGKPILNLSPFYFDNNMQEAGADSIYLRCYDYFTDKTGKTQLSYCNMDNLGIPKYLEREQEEWKNIRIYEHIENLINLLKQ